MGVTGTAALPMRDRKTRSCHAIRFRRESNRDRSGRRSALLVLAGTMLAVAGMAIAPATMAKDGSDAGHWVGTWNASPQAAWHPLELNGQTIRQIVHVSIGGTRVRVRLSNAYGADPLLIGAARVGLRSTGASIVPGSDRVLTFNGSESTTIPAGALAVSDPVKSAGCPTAATWRSASTFPAARSRRPSIRWGCRRPISRRKGISAAPTPCRRRPPPSPSTS